MGEVVFSESFEMAGVLEGSEGEVTDAGEGWVAGNTATSGLSWPSADPMRSLVVQLDAKALELGDGATVAVHGED